MNQNSTVLPDYRISQDCMLADSAKTIIRYTDDQAAFEAFDEYYASPFGTNWADALKKANNTLPDSVIAAKMKLSSEEVDKKMENCRNCFQIAKYFIEKAFPNNTTVWNQFGYSDYMAARKSHDKMHSFLTYFHDTAVMYQTELTAANYSVDNTANILVVRDDLLAYLAKQHVKMNDRLLATKSRIEELNDLWSTRLKVSKAAKVIFADDFVRYNMYLLPASEEHTKTFNFKGVVTELGTGKKLYGAMIILGNGIPIIKSDSNGKFGGAKIPAKSYTALITLNGYLTKNVPINIEEGKIYVAYIELEIDTRA